MAAVSLPVPVFVLTAPQGDQVSCTVGKFMHAYIDAIVLSKDTPYNGRYQMFYRHVNAVWQFLLSSPAKDGSPTEQDRLWKKFKEVWSKTPEGKQAEAFEIVPLNQLFKRMVAFTARNVGSGLLAKVFDTAGWPDATTQQTFTTLFEKGVLLSLPPKKGT